MLIIALLALIFIGLIDIRTNPPISTTKTVVVREEPPHYYRRYGYVPPPPHYNPYKAKYYN